LIANFAPAAYPRFKIANDFVKSVYSGLPSLAYSILLLAFHVIPFSSPVPCLLPVPLTSASAIAAITALVSSSIRYASNAWIDIFLAAAEIENTLRISYPLNSTVIFLTLLFFICSFSFFVFLFYLFFILSLLFLFLSYLFYLMFFFVTFVFFMCYYIPFIHFSLSMFYT